MTTPDPGDRDDLLVTLGIDIGDTTGFLLAGWQRAVREAVLAKAFQCDRATAPDLLEWICGAYAGLIRLSQLEAFVDRLAGRKLRGTRAAPIRTQQGELTAVAAGHGVTVVGRGASNVKNWATDARLRRAGLYEVTAGLPHARDAGRHAAYAAVHDCGLRDPLSKGRAGSADTTEMTMEPAHAQHMR